MNSVHGRLLCRNTYKRTSKICIQAFECRVLSVWSEAGNQVCYRFSIENRVGAQCQLLIWQQIQNRGFNDNGSDKIKIFIFLASLHQSFAKARTRDQPWKKNLKFVFRYIFLIMKLMSIKLNINLKVKQLSVTTQVKQRNKLHSDPYAAPKPAAAAPLPLKRYL